MYIYSTSNILFCLFIYFRAAHNVHHSSPDYNFSTALRQGAEFLFNWIFYLPMAIIVPPPTYVFYQSMNTVYQFWVHNTLVGNMGVLEYVLNTPSAHRVHHARNYKSCNFAGKQCIAMFKIAMFVIVFFKIATCKISLWRYSILISLQTNFWKGL